MFVWPMRNTVPGRRYDLADAQVADEDAVARVEIAQAIAVVARADLEVRARDRFVLDDEVADDAAAAGDARLEISISLP